MKTDDDVQRAIKRYLENPDGMFEEVRHMPHEALVIFTMQLFNMTVAEMDTIAMLMATNNSTSPSCDLSMAAVTEGVCAVSQWAAASPEQQASSGHHHQQQHQQRSARHTAAALAGGAWADTSDEEDK